MSWTLAWIAMCLAAYLLGIAGGVIYADEIKADIKRWFGL